MTKDLKEVRILMLGEPGVGKTSLVLSLVSEQFIESDDPSFDLPSKLESITIPAEVTLEKVPGIIIDYSSTEQSEEDLNQEIERANVLVLVYAVNDETSKEKLKSYWMPKIQEVETKFNQEVLNSSSVSSGFLDPAMTTKRPIIIVANKTDSLNNRENLVNDQLVSRLIRANNQIETCIQCSAKTLKNVPEVFYYAQKSILYPTTPVYDDEKKKLTEQCVKCLTRIFKICDHDNDGLLNDKELNDFQLKSFGVHLNTNSLQGVKALLQDNNTNAADNLINNEITLNGFIYMHTLFIKKGRHETTWTVLKKFGYDRNLTLSRDYSSVNLKVPATCSLELSLRGFEFLQYLFKRYDMDHDGCLNKKELNDLFSYYSIKTPWGNDVHNTVETDEDMNLTYCGFLSQWVLTAYFDLKAAAELLAYLGYNNYYDENQASAFNVSRPKELDVLKKSTYRSTFLCYVYGRKQSGKTAFLQGLLGRDLDFQAKLSPEEITRWSCNLVQFQNIEKYLILKEINSSDLELHEAYPPDVVIFLYDVTDPNSFQFIADIFLSVYKDRPIPCMLVGTKCDQTELPQKYPLNAELFAEKYKLPPPQFFSASAANLPNMDIYAKIVAIASYPKMYPMRSQIWRFFQKLGAAATAASYSSKGMKKSISKPRDLNKKSPLFNPITFFSNKFRASSTNDPDSMLLRYSILTASCVTVAFILIKILR